MGWEFIEEGRHEETSSLHYIGITDNNITHQHAPFLRAPPYKQKFLLSFSIIV